MPRPPPRRSAASTRPPTAPSTWSSPTTATPSGCAIAATGMAADRGRAPLPPGLSMIDRARPRTTLARRAARPHLPRFRAAPPPDPERGDWTAWEALLASREGAARRRRSRGGLRTVAARDRAVGTGVERADRASPPACPATDARPLWRCPPRGRPILRFASWRDAQGLTASPRYARCARRCRRPAAAAIRLLSLLAADTCYAAVRRSDATVPQFEDEDRHVPTPPDLRRQGQGPVRGARAGHARAVFQGRRDRLQQPEEAAHHRQGRAQQPHLANI